MPTELTGKPWSPSTVSLFLRPRNAGLRSHNDEIIGKGTWPGLVDESTWRAAQSVLNAPGAHRAQEGATAPADRCVELRQTGLRRLLVGSRETTTGRITYACKQCRGVSVRAEHVEPLLYRAVGGRLAMPDAVDLLKSEIHDEAEAESIRLELETLYGEVEPIGIERGQRLLTGRQAKIATDLDQRRDRET